MASAGSRVGSWFGPYRLTRLLGSGGFGEVNAAHDADKDRMVALKLMTTAYSADPIFRQRLFREASTAGRLNEPHVVPIHSYGEIDGQLYIDMRLVDGTDLQKLLAHTDPLDPNRAVWIIRQIAAALDAAHASHRQSPTTMSRTAAHTRRPRQPKSIRYPRSHRYLTATTRSNPGHNLRTRPGI